MKNNNPFDRVIGYASVKSELLQIADTLRNPEAYRKLGAEPPRGLMLHGAPGVGKTLMATALMEESGCPVFTCRKDKPNGEFIREIKETFDRAAESAPSIVLLDDVDKFTNGDPRRRDAEEYVTVQSCIDQCKAKGAEVFVLATANAVEHLPHSLLRAGRFDRVIEVEAPTGRDAEAIVAHYIQDKHFDESVDPKTVARLLDGRSCAQLEMCINAAGLLAGYRRAEKITMKDFTEAVLRTIFDVPVGCNDDEDFEDWYSGRGQQSPADMLCCHEAGHAVVSEILCPGSVTLVSAHCRGGGSDGFTAYRQDPNMTGMQWRISRVVASLGGMAAVEQQFGVLDSGCSKDLNQAHNLVYGMVQHENLCGFALHESPRQDSEALLHATEQAAAAETEKYFRKAKEILSLNREYLDAVAAELKARKLLTNEDMQRLRAACTIVPVAA